MALSRAATGAPAHSSGVDREKRRRARLNPRRSFIRTHSPISGDLRPSYRCEPLSFQGLSPLLFVGASLYYIVKRRKHSDRRSADMKIDKVLAVYNTSPLRLVVESDEGKLLELSFPELKEAGYSFSDAAWKSLVEDFQIFNSQHASR
jgi:hypothetical protein